MATEVEKFDAWINQEFPEGVPSEEPLSMEDITSAAGTDVEKSDYAKSSSEVELFEDMIEKEQEKFFTEELISQEEKDDKEKQRRLENINLQIGFGDYTINTGYKVSDFVDSENVAKLVGAGHMAMSTWRGIKQIIGIDEAVEKENERYMNDLLASEKYGDDALVGEIAGAFIDPATIATGAFVGVVSKAEKINKIQKTLATMDKISKTKRTAATGAASGAAWGAVGYVDEESGDSRLDKTAIGSLFGGAIGGVIGKVVDKSNKALKAGAMADIQEFERLVGARVDAGETVKEAVKNIKLGNEEYFNRVMDLKKTYGIQPDLVNAAQSYRMATDYAMGTSPLDVGNYRSPSAFNQGVKKVVNAVDKFTGITSSRMRDISLELGGRAKRFEAALHVRPETYRKERGAFADLFTPSSTSGRKIHNKSVAQFSPHDTNTLKYYLVNGEFDKAEDFLLKNRGRWAVDAFKQANAALQKNGREMKGLGIIDEMEDNYWPRIIKRDRMDDYLKALSKETSDTRLVAQWQEKLKKLEDRANERGFQLSEYEKTQAFMSFINKQENSPITVNGFAKSRSLKKIPLKWIEFYEDPIASFDAHIHRTIKEIEVAKFIGKDAYGEGLKNAKDVDGLFNLNKAMDFSKIFANIEDPTERQLAFDLVKLRLGKSMASPNDLVNAYKGVVNMGLLSNFISAATQLGDIANSAYKNGIMTSANNFVKATAGRGTIGKNRIKVSDLGLEKIFQEFEDVKGGMLKSAQEFLFKWSGFKAVDEIGKEVFVNSAISKAKKMIDNTDSYAYREFEKKYRAAWGSDFDRLVTDLKAYKEGKTEANENILTYVFTELSEMQPISRLETPELYLRSNSGKFLYTLKTYLMKQLDVLRNDVVNKAVYGDKEDKLAAGRNLVKYVTLLGAGNMSVDWVKSKALGDESKNPLNELPEKVGLAWTLGVMETMGLSALRTFGLNNYTLNSILKSGPTGIWEDLIFPPGIPAVQEGWNLIMDGATQEEVDAIKRYIPLVGRNLHKKYIPGVYDERDFETNMSYDPGDPALPQGDKSELINVFAEGGLVEHSNPVINNPPPVTEAANTVAPENATPTVLPEVTPQDSANITSQIEETNNIEPVQEEGMTHSPVEPMGEKGQAVFDTIEDVIDAAGSTWENMDLGDKLTLMSAPIPVVGDLIGLGNDIKTYWHDPESNTWSNYGLTALGVIPFIPNMSLGIKIMQGGKAVDVGKILEANKSPFEGKEVELWRGVEAGTIKEAQGKYREITEHSTTNPSLAARFAEDAAQGGKVGSINKRKEVLQKGIVIKDAEHGHNGVINTVNSLLEHPDFLDDKENRVLLLKIKEGYNKRKATLNAQLDSLPLGADDPGFDRISNQLDKMEEIYGNYTNALLRKKGYDHIAYINTHELLPNGEYDASVGLIYPNKWEEVGRTAKEGKELYPELVQKYEAGVYSDTNGNFFEVTEDNKIVPYNFGEE